MHGIPKSQMSRPLSSHQLLLDEECAQVSELPRASDAKDGELDQSPSDDAGVCAFGLVAEFGFALLFGC